MAERSSCVCDCFPCHCCRRVASAPASSNVKLVRSSAEKGFDVFKVTGNYDISHAYLPLCHEFGSDPNLSPPPSLTPTMMKRSYGTPAEVPTSVQVIAPATLSAGYTFEASYNSVTFPVTVPQGGVTEGQRFIVPFLPPTAVAKAVPMQSDAEIPTGAWRDSLWNCCAFGPCHSHFLNSWFCRSVLIGQLLTRMKMDWLGSLQRRNDSNDDAGRNYHQGWRNSFRNLILLTVAFYLLMAVTTTPQTMDPSMQSSFQDQAKTNNDASQPDQYIITNASTSSIAILREIYE